MYKTACIGNDLCSVRGSEQAHSAHHMVRMYIRNTVSVALKKTLQYGDQSYLSFNSRMRQSVIDWIGSDSQ